MRGTRPAAGGTHIGDVAGPGVVGRIGPELALQQVVGHGQIVAAVGGVDELAPPSSAQPVATDERAHPVSSSAQAQTPDRLG